MQQMSDGDSDGGEISSVGSEEDQDSDSSSEAPQYKQICANKFVPIAPSTSGTNCHLCCVFSVYLTWDAKVQYIDEENI